MILTCKTVQAFSCFLKEACQQSIHYMAVDYPLFEITQWAKSPRLALRGTVHVGVIIQKHKKPNSTKTPLQEIPQPQTTAEGLFKSGCHILSLFILTQVLFWLLLEVQCLFMPLRNWRFDRAHGDSRSWGSCWLRPNYRQALKGSGWTVKIYTAISLISDLGSVLTDRIGRCID